MEKHTIRYGEKTIEYELQRKNVKNINLKVKPDLSVVVSANKNVPLDYIESFVKSKAGWIVEKLQFFNRTRNHNTAREFVSGETIRYLGKQYRLKVVKAEPEEEGVKFYQGYIYLHVKDKEDYWKKHQLFSLWAKEKATIAFNESMERMYPKIRKYGIGRPSIVIRKMKTRWGSCSRDKQKITLNSELIKAPKQCIDYVMLHELIHFKFRNHNQDFYNFLTVLMPDWKERKALLDSEIILDV